MFMWHSNLRVHTSISSEKSDTAQHHSSLQMNNRTTSQLPRGLATCKGSVYGMLGSKHRVSVI